MIADTTFVSRLLREMQRGERGPARTFFAEHRREAIRTTIITAAEFALMFDDSAQAFQWLRKWKIYRLHDGIAAAAADVDRELMKSGQRLGENDNWIAGFGAYYREPIISHDEAFDRAPGVRRIVYTRE